MTLYASDDPDAVIAVETALIQTFKDSEKCDNDNNDMERGSGGVADSGTRFVYLAIWYAEDWRSAFDGRCAVRCMLFGENA